MRSAPDFYHMNIGPLVRKQLAAEYCGGTQAEVSVPIVRVPPESTESMAMIVGGEAGPLTLEQSRYGAAIAVACQALAKKRLAMPDRAALADLRMKARRSNDTAVSKKISGVNLSRDPGTVLRDSLGLPVMTGSSCTAWDIILSHQHAVEKSGAQFYAPQLDDAHWDMTQKKHLMTDLALTYMRKGALPQYVAGLLNDVRIQYGMQAKEVRQDLVQTHSYPEVSASVELALAGRMGYDEDALLLSSRQALQRLESLTKSE